MKSQFFARFIVTCHRYRFSLLVAVLFLLRLTSAWMGGPEKMLWHSDAGWEMRDILEIWKYGRLLPFGAPSGTFGYAMPPFFYYLMAPVAWLTGGNAGIVAMWLGLLGSLTVLVLYAWIKELTRSRWTALAVAGLFALSGFFTPMLRNVWSLYPVYFFMALYWYLATLLLTRISTLRIFGFALVTGMLFGFHTFVFFALPLAFGYLFFLFTRMNSNKQRLASVGVFLTGIALPNLPLIGYELANNFPNLRGFIHDVLQSAASQSSWHEHLAKQTNELALFMSHVLLPKSTPFLFQYAVALAVAAALICLTYNALKPRKAHTGISGLGFFLMFVVLGLLQVMLYRGPMAERYFVAWYLVPVVTLPMAAWHVCQQHPVLLRWKKLLLACVAILYLLYGTVNLVWAYRHLVASPTPVTDSYYGDIAQVADAIAQHAGTNQFAFYNVANSFVQTDFQYFWALHQNPFDCDASLVYVFVPATEPHLDKLAGVCSDKKLVFENAGGWVYLASRANCLLPIQMDRSACDDKGVFYRGTQIRKF